jgi:hypothetical protein
MPVERTITNADPFSYVRSDALVDQCFEALQNEGFHCLEGAVPAEYLAQCQEQVRELVREQGERYFSIVEPCKTPGSRFAPLFESESFYGLLRALSAKAAGQESIAGESSPYNVLRVVAGPQGTEKSMMFHYDATVVTALVPLLIPDGRPDEAGDLVVATNLRRIRASALFNVLEKIVMQNSIARLLLSRLLLRGGSEAHIRRLKPGNIYLFWGYRTLHANLSVKPNAVRSTLLFHVGNPHRSSPLVNMILWARKRREARRLVA